MEQKQSYKIKQAVDILSKTIDIDTWGILQLLINEKIITFDEANEIFHSDS